MPTEPTGTIVPAADTCAPDQVLHLPSGTLHLRPVDVAREHPVLTTRADTPIDQLAHLLGSLAMAGDESSAAEVLEAIPPALLERAEAARRAWRAAREADRDLTQRALAAPVGAATAERQAAWRAWLDVPSNREALSGLLHLPPPAEAPIPPYRVTWFVDAAGGSWHPSTHPARAWENVVGQEVDQRLDPEEAGSCFDAPDEGTVDALRRQLQRLHRVELTGPEAGVRAVLRDLCGGGTWLDHLDEP